MTCNKVILLTYVLVNKFPQSKDMMAFHVNSPMVVKWYSFCEEICTKILQYPNQKVGPQQTTELDEPKFGNSLKRD
jgi:hypothetical protein